VPRARGHVAALDGLRGLAIAGVVVQHVIIADRGYWMGVDLFFVLSGLLITSTLLGSLQQHGSLRLGHFAWRRFMRLAPALATMLVLWSLWVLATGHEVAARLDYVPLVLAQATNVAGAAGGEISPDLGHLWSLAAEVQFYVVWPLVLAVLVWRRASQGVLLAGVAGAALLSALLRFGLSFTDATWQRLYLGPDTRFDALMLGCAIGMLVSWGAFERSPRLARHVGWAAVPAVAVLVVAVTHGHLVSSIPWRGGLLAAVLASGVLVAGAAAGSARFVLPILELSVLQILGRLSYSLYLWHVPVAAEVHRLLPDWSHAARSTFTVVLSLVLAFVTLALVELPALSSKRRPATRAAVLRAATPTPEFARAS
jgi:peptidoglycan/LPS O-acetylase OafA/YrhL